MVTSSANQGPRCKLDGGSSLAGASKEAAVEVKKQASRGLVKETSWERKEDAATQKETCLQEIICQHGSMGGRGGQHTDCHVMGNDIKRSVVSASIPVSAQSKRVSADINTDSLMNMAYATISSAD